MKRLALLILLLFVTSCDTEKAAREVRVIQEWTACARPSRPVFWAWDDNSSLCSDHNLEATVTNWIMAMRYCEALESALDCYERQMSLNATGEGE